MVVSVVSAILPFEWGTADTGDTGFCYLFVPKQCCCFDEKYCFYEMLQIADVVAEIFMNYSNVNTIVVYMA